MLDVVGNRKWYFLISALLLVPGLIALGLGGLRLGVDFTGGTLWELKFREQVVPADELRGLFESADHPGVAVQVAGNDTLIVRTKQIDEGSAEKAALSETLRARFGAFDERFESVGPVVGLEIAQRAVMAVALASTGICLYLWWAFREMPNPLRYGLTTVASLIHDAIIVLGFFAVFGLLFGWEVDGLFVTAVLTVIGFSVHDTIVVFDRVRENMRRNSGEPFEVVVNHSLVQTLVRSLNTSLTAAVVIGALVMFGGPTIRSFATALLVGILAGTFSSIFFASMLLVVWENGELGRLFGRGRRAVPAEAAPARRAPLTGAAPE